MSFQGVIRPGHAALRVLDLEAAVRHYTEIIGLIETGRDSKGRVYLKGWDEHDHHSVVLRESDRPDLDHIAFKVLEGQALASLHRRLEDYGVKVDRVPAGEQLATGERLGFVIPTGHRVELYAEKEKVGNGLPTTNPDVWPDGLKGMHPTRFDHCAINGRDIAGSCRLFREVLGFDLTEQAYTDDGKMMVAFLSCSNKAHDIAFLPSENDGKLHHVSFWLDSWEQVQHAADLIAKHEVPLDYGPGRHGITRGLTIYFFDPSGNRNEVFSGGYIHYPDSPVITWTMDQIGKAIFYYDRKINESFINVLT